MKRIIQVCTQIRHSPNPLCCGHGGGVDLIQTLTEEIKIHSLNVDVAQSNCMLMCVKGPNIKLIPDGKVWNQVSSNTVPEIIHYLINTP